MAIKTIINMLPDDKKKLLMEAFELGITHIIKMADGHFVGVNVVASDSIIIEEEQGKWSIGSIKDA